MKPCGIVVGLLVTLVVTLPTDDNSVPVTDSQQQLPDTTLVDDTDLGRDKRALNLGTAAVIGVGTVGAAAVVGAGIFGVGALTGAIASRRLAGRSQKNKPNYGWSNGGFYKKNYEDSNTNSYRSYYYPHEDYMKELLNF